MILLTAMLSAGCVPRHAIAPTPVLPHTFAIQMKTHPTYPAQMDGTQFQAQIADKGSRPVSRAAVSISLAMPGMDMGRNVVTLKEMAATPGTYTGMGRFTMSGNWQATVSADRGTVHQSQVFPIVVH